MAINDPSKIKGSSMSYVGGKMNYQTLIKKLFKIPLGWTFDSSNI